MSTQMNAAAAGAREQARQANGEFGTQPRADVSQTVDLMAGTAYDTKQASMQMDCDEFESMFGGHIEAPSGNAMWDRREIEEAGIPDDRVWTVVDNGENESLYALPGYHHVNKVDYLVTPEAWGNPNIEVLWHDENDMDGEEVAAYTEFGDDQGWGQLNQTPALAPRADLVMARINGVVREMEADPTDSSIRMRRNAHVEALAMSREGRMLLRSMTDEQLGGEFYGNERESLLDHGKKKAHRLHDHFNKHGLGVDAVPVPVAEARRQLREGTQIEVVYLGKYATDIEDEKDYRVVASQSERVMETLRRGEATPVRNDWLRKTTSIDKDGTVIVSDEFGAPYVAYRKD